MFSLSIEILCIFLRMGFAKIAENKIFAWLDMDIQESSDSDAT